MTEVFVGHVNEFAEGRRIDIQVLDRGVTVLTHEGEFYAIENRCIHMGGPVGEGIIIGKTEAIVDDEKRLIGETFSTTQKNIVCPWHGYEYDIRTGEFCGDPTKKLRTYDVVQRGDEIYVVA